MVLTRLIIAALHRLGARSSPQPNIKVHYSSDNTVVGFTNTEPESTSRRWRAMIMPLGVERPALHRDGTDPRSRTRR